MVIQFYLCVKHACWKISPKWLKWVQMTTIVLLTSNSTSGTSALTISRQKLTCWAKVTPWRLPTWTPRRFHLSMIILTMQLSWLSHFIWKRSIFKYFVKRQKRTTWVTINLNFRNTPDASSHCDHCEQVSSWSTIQCKSSNLNM